MVRQGHRVTVIERFDEPRPLGSGLLLQPPGLAALERLGVRNIIEVLGHRITHLQGRIRTGRPIFELCYTDLAPDLHAVGIHRAALYGALWDTFRTSGARLELGRTIASRDDTLLAAADLVVDASGARSLLRAAVTERPAKPFRYGAVWASVPDIGIADGMLAQRYVGARVMLGYLPVGIRAAGEPPSAALFWSLRADRYAPWREQFDAWRRNARTLWPALGPVLDGLSGPDDFTRAEYMQFTAGRLWRGNLVLMGDAAHATSPQLGQGANHALIDAVILADALSAADDLTAAFALYTAARRAHVRFYQLASRIMTPFFQSDSRTLAWLRDAGFHPMRHLPWLHREMLRTLAGLKTGVFTSADADTLVNRLAMP